VGTILKLFYTLIIPLIVAIIGGVFLFQYSASRAPSGNLVYSWATFPTPGIGDDSLIFLFVSVENDTTSPQDNVSIRLPFGSQPVDVEVFGSSENFPDANVTYERGADEVIATVNRLRPNEVVSIQFITRGGELLVESASVSSDTAIGVHSSNSSGADPRRFSAFAMALLRISPIILTTILALYLVRRVRSYSSSVNDTAFCLLHTGSIEDATALLERNISRRGATVYELTNLASCRALLGDHQKATQLIDAAILLSNDATHDNVLLAKAILHWKMSEPMKAKEAYDAFTNHRRLWFFRPARRYQGSIILDDIAAYLAE
jgi:hypothetical protein